MMDEPYCTKCMYEKDCSETDCKYWSTYSIYHNVKIKRHELYVFRDC